MIKEKFGRLGVLWTRSSDRLSIITEGDETATILTRSLSAAFDEAQTMVSRLPPAVLEMEGMSGRGYRVLINSLIGSLPDARYLEVGSWLGSTACAAMHGNAVKVVCIDNWVEFGGPRDQFFANVERSRTRDVDFSFKEADFRSVDYAALGPFNVYLFDGPHGERDHYDGLAMGLGAMDDQFVLIVDDWNAPEVRTGTNRAIQALALVPSYKIEIRTTQNNKHARLARQQSNWHNGYAIGVYSKSTMAA